MARAGEHDAGAFQNVPPCRAASQTGCVVAYNTYDDVPPRLSLFGRTVDGRTVVCVNPGDPSGGSARLDPIVPVPSSPGAVDVVGFASYPGSVAGRCRSNATSTWLEVTTTARSQLPERALASQLSPAGVCTASTSPWRSVTSSTSRAPRRQPSPREPIPVPEGCAGEAAAVSVGA